MVYISLISKSIILSVGVIVLSILGFLLSLYSYYAEKKFCKTKRKMICDINDKISCTKAFTSIYGKTFGISNSLYGMVFYLFILILSFYNLKYVFYLSILAVLGSVYLAYVLYFKVKSFCIVCNSIYLVNILLLVFSYYYVSIFVGF